MDGKEKFKFWLSLFFSAAFIFFIFIGLLGLTGKLNPDAEANAVLRALRAEKVVKRLKDSQAEYLFEVSDGTSVRMASLSEFTGRTIFLNFWATYCPPCIEELPSLLEMSGTDAGAGMTILAVSYDESWDDIRQFFMKFSGGKLPPNIVVARDASRDSKRDLKTLFGTEKIPETYIIRNGVIESRFISAQDWMSDRMLDYFRIVVK
ncbi:MAG: TlpA family protein disulfide reductase [Deltaproteobacteria bacterium]|nr:TlpA family protein disulfide reductase [Deltaproteobacteria bacterium]